ncbi:MAG TPA: GDP-mannose 4,6-dehydratase, partial [Thermoleophilaceae bacterium]|nr:GDP-mannose 4,6-dehydratase [Thermoleophilaceae bacterium]
MDEGRRVVALRRDVEPVSYFRAAGVEERCTIALADLGDYDALVRVLNEHAVSDVFHLAAQTIVGTANRSPLGTWEANVRGTWCLLEACRTLGTVERVVVASSDKAYGSHEELP